MASETSAEHRVEPQQHDGHAERQQRRPDIAPSDCGEQVAHRVDVAGDAGDQVALLAPLVEAEREPLEVVVDARRAARALMRSPALCSHRSAKYCAAASASAIASTSAADGDQQPHVAARRA